MRNPHLVVEDHFSVAAVVVVVAAMLQVTVVVVVAAVVIVVVVEVIGPVVVENFVLLVSAVFLDCFACYQKMRTYAYSVPDLGKTHSGQHFPQTT